jgi:phosphonate transport system substrate-binding protein
MRKTTVRFALLFVIFTMALAACTPATTAPTNTTAPTVPPPTATVPAPICAPVANPPTVAAGALGSADNPIVMTFVPSGDTGKITKAGNAIADCLKQMTGLSFTIQVGTTYAASVEAMGAGKAQIGFLNTFSAILAYTKYQVFPAVLVLRKYSTNAVDPDKGLAGQIEPFYKGQFIAKVDSGIKTFADLKGKTFCFVDPNSTSGYIIPRIVLKANGIDPDVDFKATQNAGSHPNVAIAVYKGDCDAGVTYIDVLTDAATVAAYPDIATKVAAFADTDRIPNDGIQFVKDLDTNIQAAVVAGLLAMAQDPGGNAILKNLYTINGFQQIPPTYYDDFVKVLQSAGVDPATLVK